MIDLSPKLNLIYYKNILDLAVLKFFEENNISWANWAVNNKGEDSGILGFNKDRDGKGGWTEKDLSPDGKLIRKILRNEIK